MGVSQTIKRRDPVQNIQGWDLQDDLTQDGEKQSAAAHSAGLEYAHGDKIHTQEGKTEAEAAQEASAVGYNRFVLHEKRDQSAGGQIIADGDDNHEGNRDFYGIEQRVFHAGNIAAGIIIAD